MKSTIVPSAWIRDEHFRLDTSPFVSGAIQTRKLLEKLTTSKLGELTHGYTGGIYTPPIHNFTRNYVDDPAHGVSFLGSSTMSRADLSWLPLLSRRDAHSPKLSPLRLEQGMSLVSASGTIGKTAFVRSDMAGVWSSGDVMKINPNPGRILAGYLYAFLCSRFGIPLLVGGTYGTIIQHIEAAHLRDLPVPRFTPAIEQRIAAKIERAADLRASASARRTRAVQEVALALDWTKTPLRSAPTTVNASLLQRRMDALHHAAPVRMARSALSRTSDGARLGDVVDRVFEPNRGARFKVTDASVGVPFLSSSDVFSVDPVAEYLISRTRTPQIEALIIEERDVLIPRSGQIGGIIGRAVLPLETIVGMAASEHLVRVRARHREDAAFLWAVFASQPGYLTLIGTASGSSIPSLDVRLIELLEVPWPKPASPLRKRVVADVLESVTEMSNAVRVERAAVRDLEDAIEKGAAN